MGVLLGVTVGEGVVVGMGIGVELVEECAQDGVGDATEGWVFV